MGETAEAIDASLQAEETGRQHLQTTLRYLPERQSLTYAATRPLGLDLAMSLATTDTEAVPRVFDALVRSRALFLDEMAARHRSRPTPLASSRSSERRCTSAVTGSRHRLQRAEQSTARAYLKLAQAVGEISNAPRHRSRSGAQFRKELSRGEVVPDGVRRGFRTVQRAGRVRSELSNVIGDRRRPQRCRPALGFALCLRAWPSWRIPNTPTWRWRRLARRIARGARRKVAYRDIRHCSREGGNRCRGQ